MVWNLETTFVMRRVTVVLFVGLKLANALPGALTLSVDRGLDCPGGTFVDLGANRGDNLKHFFARGYAYEEVLKHMRGYPAQLPVPAQSPTSWCYHGFEANPGWKSALETARSEVLSPSVIAAGAQVNLHVPMAVTAGGVDAIALRVSGAADSAGSSIVYGHAKERRRRMMPTRSGGCTEKKSMTNNSRSSLTFSG